MILEKFEQDKHKRHLQKFIEKRNMDEHFVPDRGFIAFHEDGEPIAAGFLRLCEGDLGIIDSFISNPDASSTARAQAFELICNAVVQLGKNLKLLKLMIITEERNMLIRGFQRGFVSVPYHFAEKRLEI